MGTPLTPNWDSDLVDEHRRGISDLEWAGLQPKTAPRYKEGDIVEFKAGGCGIVCEVVLPGGGWPSQYAVRPVAGRGFHPEDVYAWHYEGDFRAVTREV